MRALVVGLDQVDGDHWPRRDGGIVGEAPHHVLDDVQQNVWAFSIGVERVAVGHRGQSAASDVCLDKVMGDQPSVMFARGTHSATDHTLRENEAFEDCGVSVEALCLCSRPKAIDEPDQAVLGEALSSPRTFDG